MYLHRPEEYKQKIKGETGRLGPKELGLSDFQSPLTLMIFLKTFWG